MRNPTLRMPKVQIAVVVTGLVYFLQLPRIRHKRTATSYGRGLGVSEQLGGQILVNAKYHIASVMILTLPAKCQPLALPTPQWSCFGEKGNNIMCIYLHVDDETNTDCVLAGRRTRVVCWREFLQLQLTRANAITSDVRLIATSSSNVRLGQESHCESQSISAHH